MIALLVIVNIVIGANKPEIRILNSRFMTMAECDVEAKVRNGKVRPGGQDVYGRQIMMEEFYCIPASKVDLETAAEALKRAEY